MTERALIAIGLAALGGCVIGNNTEATPVQFEAGAPRAVGFAPGVIVHEVCVAVDVDDGYLRPVALVAAGEGDRIGPATGAAVQPLPVDGLTCPPASAGYRGWARAEWWTQLGRGVVTFEHSAAPQPAGGGTLIGGDSAGADAGADDDLGFAAAPAPTAASAGEIVLEGERFAGYQVTVGDATADAGGIVTVPIDVAYRDAGALVGRAADDVALRLSYVPVDLVVFGTSTGGDGVRTDVEGHVDVLFRTDALDCEIAEQFTVYVTPPSGGTSLAASLPCAAP